MTDDEKSSEQGEGDGERPERLEEGRRDTFSKDSGSGKASDGSDKPDQNEGMELENVLKKKD